MIQNKIGDIRSKNAQKNSLLMLILRGSNILISFLYVPLLINSLNDYKYGIWLTITSLLSWLNLLDIGLGNGLRNKLSEAIAKEEILKGQILVSTAYFVLFIFVFILVSLFLLLSSFIDWCRILNVPDSMNWEISRLANTVFVLFFIQLFLSLINSVLYALQKPFISTLISTIGQLFSFISVCVSVYCFEQTSLVFLGTIITIVPIIILFCSSLYIYKNICPQFSPRFNKVAFIYLQPLLSIGMKFFYLQVITIILYQTCNIIISHSLTPAYVTEYNIVYKYMGVINMVFSIITIPYWSATTDAYTKGDYNWIRKSFIKIKRIRYLLGGVGLLQIVLAPLVYRVWLGEELKPDIGVLFLSWCYFIFNMIYLNYGIFLNGMGKIKLQMFITTITAVLFIPTAYLLSKQFGVSGIFYSLIFVSVVNDIWSYLQYNKILSGKDTGLWGK